MKKGITVSRKLLAVALCCSMALSLLAGLRIDKSISKAAESNQYVYFGNYCQKEVTNQNEIKTIWDIGKVWQNNTAVINGITVKRKSNIIEYDGFRYYKSAPIKWKVLSDDGDSYLLLSDKILDSQTYSSSTGWPDSGIRKWCNDTFYNEAFTNEEKNDLIEETLDNDCLCNNPIYTHETIESKDYVWLLDEDDVTSEKYGFSASSDASDTRIAYNTQYLSDEESAGTWYLRGDPYWYYYNSYVGQYIYKNGGIHVQSSVWDGQAGGNYAHGVRPVIRVKKNSKYLYVKEPKAKEISASEENEIFTSTESMYEDSIKKIQRNSKYSGFNRTLNGVDMVIPGIRQTNIGNGTCKEMVPQGICITDKYFLISAYCANEKQKHNSVIYVMNKKAKKYITTLALDNNKSHVGSLAWNNTKKEVYIADSANKKIWRLNESVIEDKVAEKSDYTSTKLKNFISINSEKNFKPSFISYYSSKLYVGQFDEANDANSYMTVYRVDESNQHENERIKLPLKCQGIAFVDRGEKTYLLCSCSYQTGKDSHIYACELKKAKDISKKINSFTNASQVFKEVSFPEMSEDLTLAGNVLYTCFESAANKYAKREHNKSEIPFDRIAENAAGSLIDIIDLENPKIRGLSATSDVVDDSSVIEEGTCGEFVHYTLYKNGLLNITGQGDMEDYSKTDAPWKAKAEEIKNISVGADVTSIGKGAFQNCGKLETVSVSELSDTETTFTIGSNAFSECVSLNTVKLPDKKFVIELDAFPTKNNLVLQSDAESIAQYCNLVSGITNHKHDYQYFKTIEPTCGSYGYELYRCTCGAEECQNLMEGTSKHDFIITDKEESTCQEKGSITYQCQNCGVYNVKENTLSDHKWIKKQVVQPTSSKKGYTVYICSVCNATKTSDYTTIKPSPNNKNTKLKKTGKVTGLKVKNKKKKKIVVKWRKKTNVAGYQIQYALNKKFTKKKKSKWVGKKKSSKTISKLKKGKKYYIRVRAYRKKSGKKLYGKWSKVKKVKIKK